MNTWRLGLPEASSEYMQARQIKDHTVLALFAITYSYPSRVIFRDKRKCVPE